MLDQTSSPQSVGFEVSSEITDQSYRYLQADNYMIDQFSCVVNGFGYYRLTNNHPDSIIGGFVRRSWVYNNETISEDKPFTLRPKGQQTFGCFFISESQQVSFSIYSSFVKPIDTSANNWARHEEFSCNCGDDPEGEFKCINGILYRCISNPEDGSCAWYDWGVDCDKRFF